VTLLEPAEFPRDRWGRPRVNVDGKLTSYARPSSFGDCIDNRYNLERYIRRNIVIGLKAEHSLWARLNAAGDDRDELNKICEDAQVAAKANSKADLGTALHKMTERVDRGETLSLPPEFANDIDAYQRALPEAGLTVVPGMIEMRCVCDELQAAGTFDRIVEDASGTRFIGDVKTGASSDYPHGFAVQLAIYAHSLLYDPETGERRPMPDNLDTERGIIIHLPAGQATCSVYYIDLAAGWEAALHAKWVKDTWQKRKGLLTPVATVASATTLEPVEAMRLTRSPSLEQLRAECADFAARPESKAALLAVWPKGISLKADSLSPGQRALVAAAIDKAEADLLEALADEQEFMEDDPAVPLVDEGIDLTPDDLEAIARAFKGLEPQQRDVISLWIQEGITAERDWRLRPEAGGKPTERRFEIARAAVAWAEYDADIVRAALALVLGDLVQSHPIGALLGSLTIDEAKALEHAASALCTGGLVLNFDRGGKPVLGELPQTAA
jgi:hypothetical protein